MATNLPRPVWVLVCAIGVVVAVVFALIPVGVSFGDDPLLRLRQLDPELSPPAATAVCGSPLTNLRTERKGTSLYELARSHACEQASRRRLFAAVAGGSLIVVLGLLGLTAGTEEGRAKSVGLLSHSG